MMCLYDKCANKIILEGLLSQTGWSHLKYYYFPQIICYTDKKLGRIHLPKSLSDTYFDLIFGIVYYRFKSSSLRFWKFTSSIKMRIFIWLYRDWRAFGASFKWPVSPTDPAVSWDLQNVSLHGLNIQSFCLEYDAKVLSHPSIIYILLSSSAGFLKVFQCSSLDISCFFIYFQSSLCIGPCFKKQTNKQKHFHSIF